METIISTNDGQISYIVTDLVEIGKGAFGTVYKGTRTKTRMRKRKASNIKNQKYRTKIK